MFKRSPLNAALRNAAIIINEETISLGNSRNTSSIFRKHKFTVIRPNMMVNVMDPIDVDVTKNKPNLGSTMLNKLKGKITSSKTDPEQFIDISLIPNHVLINPSQWGLITKKNKDGSLNTYETSNDVLLSLRQLIGFQNDITISIQFKLKATNV